MFDRRCSSYVSFTGSYATSEEGNGWNLTSKCCARSIWCVTHLSSISLMRRVSICIEVAGYPTGPSMYKPCLGGYPNLGSDSWNNISKKSCLPGGVIVSFNLIWDDPNGLVFFSAVETTKQFCGENTQSFDYCYKTIDNGWFGLTNLLARCPRMGSQNRSTPRRPFEGKDEETSQVWSSSSGSTFRFCILNSSIIWGLGGQVGLWEISSWRVNLIWYIRLLFAQGNADRSRILYTIPRPRSVA